MHLEGDAHSPRPNTVGRVIEDLERSGYRPLHRSLTAEPATSPGEALGTGCQAGAGEVEVRRGSHTPV